MSAVGIAVFVNVDNDFRSCDIALAIAVLTIITLIVAASLATLFVLSCVVGHGRFVIAAAGREAQRYSTEQQGINEVFHHCVVVGIKKLLSGAKVAINRFHTKEITKKSAIREKFLLNKLYLCGVKNES